MEVKNNRAQLKYDCAHGAIKQSFWIAYAVSGQGKNTLAPLARVKNAVCTSHPNVGDLKDNRRALSVINTEGGKTLGNFDFLPKAEDA